MILFKIGMGRLRGGHRLGGGSHGACMGSTFPWPSAPPLLRPWPWRRDFRDGGLRDFHGRLHFITWPWRRGGNLGLGSDSLGGIHRLLGHEHFCLQPGEDEGAGFFGGVSSFKMVPQRPRRLGRVFLGVQQLGPMRLSSSRALLTGGGQLGSACVGRKHGSELGLRGGFGSVARWYGPWWRHPAWPCLGPRWH